MNELCYIYEWAFIKTPTASSQVANLNKSCHTDDGILVTNVKNLCHERRERLSEEGVGAGGVGGARRGGWGGERESERETRVWAWIGQTKLTSNEFVHLDLEKKGGGGGERGRERRIE